MVDVNSILDYGSNLVFTYGPKLLLAIVVLVIGLWIIKLIAKGVDKMIDHDHFEDSLRHFLVSLLSIGLKILLLLSVVSMLGVETTSFVALVAALGFAVGFALQGSLSNFAGGVLILLFKPFKVGDFIDAQGFAGTVNKIEIFNTILKTPDNKTIIIPNGPLSNGPITNVTTEKNRRVDFVFGIGYNDDVDKAKKVIQSLIKKDKRIHKDPEPFVKVSELADSSVNITVRVWTAGKDYWGVHFDMIENVKAAFDKNKISIPYPQMDVHVQKE